jgi:hypothetical protein
MEKCLTTTASRDQEANRTYASKVIRPSNENNYSNVHLVKKPNNSWRFCIDYRRLNRLITAMGWKVPNIPMMFQRIGEATSILRKVRSDVGLSPSSDAS